MVSYSTELLATLAQLGEDGVDAVLVDGAQGSRGNTRLHPAVLAGDPEPALVQVGKETATGLVVRVRDVVAGRRTLAGDLADSGHCTPRQSVRGYLLWPRRRRPRRSHTGRTATQCGNRCAGRAESRFRPGTGPGHGQAAASRPLWRISPVRTSTWGVRPAGGGQGL